MYIMKPLLKFDFNKQKRYKHAFLLFIKLAVIFVVAYNRSTLSTVKEKRLQPNNVGYRSIRLEATPWR